MEPASNSSKRRAWSLGRIVVCLLATLGSGFFGAVIGFGVGADYGGNYATEFEFAGSRGYEATGLIGGIIGFVVGGLVCLFLAWGLTRRKTV